MSRGGETYIFQREDDEAAKSHLEEATGGSLSPIKRNVRFDLSTLSRVVE